MIKGPLTKWFEKNVDPLSPTYQRSNDWRYIPARVVRVTHIPITVQNENDWEFEVIDAGNGVKRLAVF